jgi:nucleoside phosphorylase/HEAT repeat protein
VIQYLADKNQAWKDLHRLTSDEDYFVRQWVGTALGISFQYLPDKNEAWEDLHRLTSDEDRLVRQWVVVAIETAFQHLPDKKQAWNDLHRLVSDEDSDVRQRVAAALNMSFEYLPEKQKAWGDLYRLVSDENYSVRQEALASLENAYKNTSEKNEAWADLHKLTLHEDKVVRQRIATTLGTSFQYLPNMNEAWTDLHKLTLDKETIVRQWVAIALGTSFQYLPDKNEAWIDLHKLTVDEESIVRQWTITALSTSFEYLPEKQKAWEDLIRLASEKNNTIQKRALGALGKTYKNVLEKQKAWEDLIKFTLVDDDDIKLKLETVLVAVFENVPEKQKAWEDLAKLISDKDRFVRFGAVSALGTVFEYMPEKQKAWEYLHKLTFDKDRFVRLGAVTALGTSFQYLPDKNEAWIDLHRLTADKDSYIRGRAAGVIGSSFENVPEKQQAETDLMRLTYDEEIDVKVRANHSLGKISVYKASKSENNDVYINELEKAINFFEKASNEALYYNPSSFCLPFYRSFYTIISSVKQQAEGEVDNHLIEAKSAIEGSENKRLLFEIVENLANALKEVLNLENIDLQTKTDEIDFYRRHCDKAEYLMRDTEKIAPFATVMMRKGLPILEKNVKDILEEIQEKSKTTCLVSKGTVIEEIATAVDQEIQKWKIGSTEEMTLYVENFIFTLESKIPKLPENEHIFGIIEESKNQKDINKLLESASELIEIIPEITIDLERMKPTIGIITALPKEYAAVNILLKNKNEKYKIPGSGAGRRYCLGEILTEEGNKHSLVLTTVGMGNNIAATRASLLLGHFPNIKSIIMVGIAGGIPNPNKVNDHVRLGDIVISNEQGVIQYDYIENRVEKIEYRNPPRPPSASLVEAVRYLEAEEILGNRPWEKYIDQALSQLKIERPSEDDDRLHCSKNQDEIIEHPKDKKRTNGKPKVFIGPIASANILQKNPVARDGLRDRFKVKAIEMEASGIADATWTHDVGYLVVRGICDYCDSHKNDEWQQYAAVVAAAYMRALIESMP